MRIRSTSIIGLCLSLAACTVSTASEQSGAGAGEPAAEGVAMNDEGASNAAPAAESDPSAPANADSDADPAVDSGSAPLGDAGVDAAPKPKIPAPTKGYLHAYTSTGTCEFSLDGVYKSTGTVLDLSLYGDGYVVGCKHSSGKYIEKAAIIEAGKTSNVLFDIQIIPAPSYGTGTLVAVAVGGSCAFSVNGVFIGSGATVTEELEPGTYSVACKPVSGATKSRSVTVSAGNTAMAMFKL
jgi:hypothetical protein